ncbi:hypothetical protein BH24ACT15_BH24ACT15_30720 [soil metagenome]
MAVKPTDSWGEYSRLVLAQLDTNTEAIKELGNSLHLLRTDIGVQLGNLRVQAVKDLGELESHLTVNGRAEVALIRTHIDKDIAETQQALDEKIKGVSIAFDKRVADLQTSLQAFVKDLSGKVESLTVAVAGLQIKAGLWGAGGSILGVIAIWLISQLPKLLK